MQRIFFLFSFFIFSYLTTHAQNFRINAYGSYAFSDNVDSYYDNTNFYRGKINGGFQWGTGVEFMTNNLQGFELLYLNQKTKAPITYYNSGIKFTNFDLGVNYIMLASNRYFRKPGSTIEPYAGGLVGVDIMNLHNPENGNHNSITKFAWGIRGGINIWASSNVGIKFQTQLLSAVQSVGGGFYFGTGGVGTGLSSYSSMYQFSLGGGIVYRIPQQKK